MKFVFETKASEYDLAAEQEILLRHVSNRRRNWRIAAGLCIITSVLAVILIATKFADTTKTLQITGMVVGVILFEQGYLDYTSGNPRGYLKMLYRGRTMQTREDLEKLVRLEITDGMSVAEIFNENGKAGEWNLARLCRVTESDKIFELVCSGMPKQFLALPKSALREGTVEDFRAAMRERLGGKKEVEYFEISARRQKQLMEAKYKLFKH